LTDTNIPKWRFSGMFEIDMRARTPYVPNKCSSSAGGDFLAPKSNQKQWSQAYSRFLFWVEF